MLESTTNFAVFSDFEPDEVLGFRPLRPLSRGGDLAGQRHGFRDGAVDGLLRLLLLLEHRQLRVHRRELRVRLRPAREGRVLGTGCSPCSRRHAVRIPLPCER